MLKDNRVLVELGKYALLALFVAFGIYVNAQKVPALEASVQKHEVRLSVAEANYGHILKTLERIERRLK